MEELVKVKSYKFNDGSIIYMSDKEREYLDTFNKLLIMQTESISKGLIAKSKTLSRREEFLDKLREREKQIMS